MPHLNWTWLLVSSAIGVIVVGLLFFSQRFWYRAIWRVTSNWGSQRLRVAARLIYVALLLLIIGATADGFRMGRSRLTSGVNTITIFAGLWFSSAIFAYLAVKLVRGLDRSWAWLRAAYRLKTNPTPRRSAHPSTSTMAHSSTPAAELISDPSRRYFFKTATAL